MADKTQEQLIDELLKDYKGPESFWGESGLFAQLKKKIIERTLNAVKQWAVLESFCYLFLPLKHRYAIYP
jgi:hypothetical protein